MNEYRVDYVVTRTYRGSMQVLADSHEDAETVVAQDIDEYGPDDTAVVTSTDLELIDVVALVEHDEDE